MKLWIKYILGIILGLAAAIILPAQSPAVNATFAALSEFAIRFGRYSLLPLLFFSVSSAVFTLRMKRSLIKTGLWSLALISASSAILTILGILTILLVKLPRIPITGNEKITEITMLSFHDLAMKLFPYSGFNSLLEGAFLLPAIILAAFAGAACTTDSNAYKPVTALFESLSKLCYTIMCFFTEFMAVGMIAVCAYWLASSKAALTSPVFLPLAVMLLVDFILVAFIIYPLILRFLCKDLHPYHVLYASICPLLTAFFSADSNLALLLNARHSHESLGVRHSSNAISMPLFSIFARGGTALVSTIGFITILRAYSSLGFNRLDILWICGVTFLLSFILGGLPSGGAFVTLTVLCTMYGRGFDAGYLLLKPAALLLCSFAAAIDSATAMFGSYIVAVKTHEIEHVDLKHYI